MFLQLNIFWGKKPYAQFAVHNKFDTQLLFLNPSLTTEIYTWFACYIVTRECPSLSSVEKFTIDNFWCYSDTIFKFVFLQWCSF